MLVSTTPHVDRYSTAIIHPEDYYPVHRRVLNYLILSLPVELCQDALVRISDRMRWTGSIHTHGW